MTDEGIVVIGADTAREQELENALEDMIDMYDEGMLIAAPGEEVDVDNAIDRITAVLYNEEDGD